MSSEPAPAGGRGLPRGVVVLLGMAAAIVVCGGIRAASGLLAPVFLALVLTIAVAPLSGWSRRHGAPPWASTILSIIAVYAVVIALAGGLAWSVVKLTSILPQYADKANEIVGNIGDFLGELGFSKAPTSTALSNIDVNALIGLMERLLGGVLDLLGNLFFLVTLLFFLAAEATYGQLRNDQLARSRPELAAAVHSFIKGTQSYLIVTTVFGAIVATLDAIALWVIGVPAPLVWALLSFLTNFIPNVGFVIGLVPPALLALLEGGVGDMIAVIVVYCVINLVLQTFIQPRFVGDAVGLSTTMTFLSLALWTFLLGPLGALLAVPMSLLARSILVDADPRAGWVHELLSQPPRVPRPGRTRADSPIAGEALDGPPA